MLGHQPQFVKQSDDAAGVGRVCIVGSLWKAWRPVHLLVVVPSLVCYRVTLVADGGGGMPMGERRAGRAGPPTKREPREIGPPTRPLTRAPKTSLRVFAMIQHRRNRVVAPTAIGRRPRCSISTVRCLMLLWCSPTVNCHRHRVVPSRHVHCSGRFHGHYRRSRSTDSGSVSGSVGRRRLSGSLPTGLSFHIRQWRFIYERNKATLRQDQHCWADGIGGAFAQLGW